jgi:F-type H+-transporting ATPase subunit gamma
MSGSDTAPSALVLVTSDAGLAGSYNTNLIQLAESELRRETLRRTEMVYIGKRGARYFTKRGYLAREAHLDLAGRPDLKKIDAIGAGLLEQFLAGRIGSVKLLYARFLSASTSRPTIKPWLPIQLTARASTSPAMDYIFEPTAQRIFEDLLPRWALATFRLTILEAFTSEHGARMIAMKNATDNAQELLDSLTMQRNKIRQAMITKELSEIVGTVEALK